MTQALLLLLKRQDPGRPVDVLASAWSLPLVERMNEVRRAIEMPAGHGELKPAALLALARELRAEGYSRAIVCPRSFKAALLPFLARIPERTGFRGEFRFGLINDIRPLDRMVLRTPGQRWSSLGLPRDATLPPEVAHPHLRVDTDNRRRLRENLGLDTSRPVVAICPGAEHGLAKRWPPEHFTALARHLEARGFAVWLLGSPAERELGRAISEGAGGAPLNLCGRTRLEDVIDIMSLCRAAVTNDSGLMHVAAAVGIHVVALYGPTSPDFTPPLTDNATTLYRELHCWPCFRRECPLGHHDCLRGLAPERVLDAVLQAPGVTASATG